MLAIVGGYWLYYIFLWGAIVSLISPTSWHVLSLKVGHDTTLLHNIMLHNNCNIVYTLVFLVNTINCRVSTLSINMCVSCYNILRYLVSYYFVMFRT